MLKAAIHAAGKFGWALVRALLRTIVMLTLIPILFGGLVVFTVWFLLHSPAHRVRLLVQGAQLAWVFAATVVERLNITAPEAPAPTPTPTVWPGRPSETAN